MNDTITLPSGLWLDGVHQRQVGLRPLRGADEEQLRQLENGRFPPQKTTTLLARCLTRLGDVDLTRHDPEALIRALTVGDREALLLHLRRMTLGDRLDCVLVCPACTEKMDIELRVGDLVLAPYEQPQHRYEMTLGENGRSYHVHFRLPTGADQEAIASQATADPAAAAAALLRRCLEQINSADGEPITAETEIPSDLAQTLSATMSQHDPQAELQLDLICPECGNPFVALFDTAHYFHNEIANHAAHLYREVHLLAFYYHWSEAEIMGMTSPKRQKYLELLTEALTEVS